MVVKNVDVNGNPLPCGIYLDNKDLENFTYLNTRVLSNFDNVGIVVGEEGAGKTCWTFQKALFMDHRFNIDNVVFNEQQFIKATETLPHGSAIVWDESDAASEHWASGIVRAVTKRLKRVRKNNYTMFLVTPTFFDFNKYFVAHRAIFLIDVYSKYNGKTGKIERGRFRSFNRHLMKNLFIKGKQFWNMKAEYPNYIGYFPNYPKDFPIDMSPGGDYDLKKDKAMRDMEPEVADPKKAVADYRMKCVALTKEFLETSKGVKLSQRDLAKCFKVTNATINGDLKTLKKREGLST